jgi:Protein of unknown function (DUF3703)
MKPRLENSDALRRAWVQEMTATKTTSDPGFAWCHLERAHILSQPLVGAHVRTHSAMLVAAMRRRDAKEIVGQLLRLVVAGPGSLTGRYPVGNTGGANVSAFEPMPIPEDLRTLLAPTLTPNP